MHLNKKTATIDESSCPVIDKIYDTIGNVNPASEFSDQYKLEECVQSYSGLQDPLNF